MWFKKDKDNQDSRDEAEESPAAQEGASDDGGRGVAGDESAVERVGETDGIGDTGDGVPERAARVEDVEGGERVDRGESLTDPGAVDEVPPAPREPEPTDRVGEEPIDAETGAYSDELSQALEDARGGDDVSDDEVRAAADSDSSSGDGYESRHAGGVDDSGVLADAPQDSGATDTSETSDATETSDTTETADGSSGGGSVLPADGAVTDESAVEQTPEAAAAGEDEALRDADSADSLEQDAGTDADREQREEEQSRDEEEEQARQEAERRESEEAFAREHNPEEHDLEAGAEFRQRGDWTADEHGGPQVQEPDGTVHDPDTESDESSAEQSPTGATIEDIGDIGAGSQGAGSDDTLRDPGDHGAEQHEGSKEASGGASSPEDIRDGGHGWGSAAPVESGAQPLGHPVKAWHDTMTYVLPGEPGYEADPHEWFVDGETAERAGFRAAHGS